METQQQPPSQSPRSENPKDRLTTLTNRLKHVELVKTVVDSDGWREIEDNIRALLKRKKTAQSSLNWEDGPDVFLAFKERASYMAGWIQGAEYILNDVRAALQEEQSLKETIKATEAELKEQNKREKQ